MVHGDSQHVELKKITWDLSPPLLFWEKSPKLILKTKRNLALMSCHPSMTCCDNFIKASHTSMVSNGCLLLQPHMHRPADSLSPHGHRRENGLSRQQGTTLSGGKGVPQEERAKGTGHLTDPGQQVTWATGHQTPCE